MIALAHAPEQSTARTSRQRAARILARLPVGLAKYEAFMTDLDARKTTRRNAWINVIVGAFLIVIQTMAYRVPVWSDPDLRSRVAGTALLILAVVMFVMGCWQLIRSKST